MSLLLFRWVVQLADYWTRKVDVINRGYSGYNTRLGLNMVREVVLPLKPAFVTIFFGANDASVEATPHHVPLEEFASNLEKMVKIIQDELPDTTLLLITPPPVYEPLLETMNRKKGKAIVQDRFLATTRQYAQEVKRLGEVYGLTVLDIFAEMGGEEESDARKEYLLDGLHLNER